MTDKQAQNIVLLEAAGIAAVATLGSLGRGKGLPPVSAYAAAALLGGGLMILANADSETAVALGGLALVGSALVQYKAGTSLAEAALKQLGKIGKGSKPSPGETSQSKWDALSTAATSGGGPALGPVGPTGLGGSSGGAIAGSPIPGLPPARPDHPTSGLPGYPAHDYMAPAGTTVVSPVAGVIVRLSGHDPAQGGPPGGPLGYSITINGSDGKSYFLTHVDRVAVRPGQSVTQGQPIAVVANGPASWSSPHVHMGVRG